MGASLAAGTARSDPIDAATAVARRGGPACKRSSPFGTGRGSSLRAAPGRSCRGTRLDQLLRRSHRAASCGCWPRRATGSRRRSLAGSPTSRATSAGWTSSAIDNDPFVLGGGARVERSRPTGGVAVRRPLGRRLRRSWSVGHRRRRGSVRSWTASSGRSCWCSTTCTTSTPPTRWRCSMRSRSTSRRTSHPRVCGRSHHDQRSLARRRLRPGVVDVTAGTSPSTPRRRTSCSPRWASASSSRRSPSCATGSRGGRRASGSPGSRLRGEGRRPPGCRPTTSATPPTSSTTSGRSGRGSSRPRTGSSCARPPASTASPARCATRSSDGPALGRQLRHMHREELLLLPLDQRDEWFRMHPLLARWLSSELQESTTATDGGRSTGRRPAWWTRPRRHRPGRSSTPGHRRPVAGRRRWSTDARRSPTSSRGLY